MPVCAGQLTTTCFIRKCVIVEVQKREFKFDDSNSYRDRWSGWIFQVRFEFAKTISSLYLHNFRREIRVRSICIVQFLRSKHLEIFISSESFHNCATFYLEFFEQEMLTTVKFG